MQIVKNKFNFGTHVINIMGTNEIPYFFGSQIAKILGYEIPKDAIKQHIWEKNKITIKEYKNKGGVNYLPLKNLQPNTILINEAGLYQLIFKSRLKLAEDFQDWVFSDVLPSIRKNGNGNYNLINNQLILLNEDDLHKKVVNFINNFYNDVRLIVCIPENQDTINKRINSKLKGYQKGMPDLIIDEFNHKYNGLEIEFKTPNGKGRLSEHQKTQSKKARFRKKKSLISNNYDLIIYEIIKYLNTRRIHCLYCRRVFKNETTLKNHHLYFHKLTV